MALERNTPARLPRLFYGRRQVGDFVARHDAALALGDLAHEIDLMVVDVLPETPLSRDNYGHLARGHRLYEARWTAVRYDDVRAPHAPGHILEGEEALVLAVRGNIPAIARLDEDRLGQDTFGSQVINRLEQAVELLLVCSDCDEYHLPRLENGPEVD